MSEPTKFRGFQGPNYTQVPDQLFDELLAILPGAELKVLLYIMRRTFGFKKDSDNIALSQMLTGITTRDGRQLDRGVGLSKPTLLKALRNLIDGDYVIAIRRQSADRGDESTNYRLHVTSENGPSRTGSGGSNADETPVVKKLDHGGSRILTTPVGKEVDQGVVKKTDSQETVRQETVSKNVNVTPNASPTPQNAGPAIAEIALTKRYGLNDAQVDQVRRLVDQQADVLGHRDRNHGNYVQRAAEAVRDGLASVLESALGEVKDASHRKAIGSLPAYFTRVYDAMRADATRPHVDFGGILSRRRDPSDSPASAGDVMRSQRERLIASIIAKGYRLPPNLLDAPATTIATWYDQVQRTQPPHG
jgi:Bacteriophage replication protein O